MYDITPLRPCIVAYVLHGCPIVILKIVMVPEKKYVLGKGNSTIFQYTAFRVTVKTMYEDMTGKFAAYDCILLSSVGSIYLYSYKISSLFIDSLITN